VRAEGFRTHRETIEAVAGADLLLLPVWSEDTERGRLVCPAKAYEYLASGRPVLALALPGSEAGALLAGRAGVRVHGFGDREGIERSLEEALDGRSGARAGAEDGGEFTRRAQAGRAAEVLAAAAAAGCRR
jgi:hypothetical protein